MLSLRAFSRSIPRFSPRFSSTSSVFRRSTLPFPRNSNSPLRALWQPMVKSGNAAAFSTSIRRSAPETEAGSEVNEELLAKLQSEIEIEQSDSEDREMPTPIKDFIETGPWKLSDVEGSEEVTMTRDFDNEKISLSFSIDDINGVDPSDEDDGFADRAFEDEASSTTPNPAAPQSTSEPATPEESADETVGVDGAGFPVNIAVRIKKAGAGTLHVDTLVQDGSIMIENVVYQAEGTEEVTPETKRSYTGPPFGNLDPDLQSLLERWLEERGIDTALAQFVPDYIDYKEQREYTRWLGNVKNFVET